MRKRSTVSITLTGLLLAGSTASCSLAAKLGVGGGNGKDQSAPSEGEQGGEESDPAAEPPPMTAGGGPTWCDGYQSDGDSRAKWVAGYIESEGFSDRVLSYMAMGACDRPDDPDRRAEVREWMAAYQAVFGGSGRELADTMALYIDKERREKLQAETCERFAVDREDPPAKRSRNAAIAAAMGCRTQATSDDFLWWIDRPSISELERAIWVLECAGSHAEDVRRVALCGRDIGALSRDKLAKQIEKAGLNHHGRVRAQQVFGRAEVAAAKLIEAVEAKAAKHDGWKTLLVDGPRSANAAWDELYQGNREAFAAIWAFEKRAYSEGDGGDCQKTLGALVRAKLRASKSGDFKSAARTAVDPLGYPLLQAHMHCAVLGGRMLEASVIHRLIKEAGRGPFRGPRLAAYWAWLDDLNDVRAKRKRFPIERPLPLPRTGDKVLSTLYAETFNKVRHGRAQGEIKKVKRRGDSVRVTFKKVRFKEPTYKCRPTNRIARITSDGTVEYVHKCRRTGTRTVVTEEKPVDVPRAYAADLRRGQFVVMALDETSGRVGIPVEIYRSKKRKVLRGILGTTW